MLLLDGFYAVWLIHHRYGTRALMNIVNLKVIRALGMAWLIGILLSLPQTLPTLEYMQQSARIAARQAGYSEIVAKGIAGLPELVLPYFYGVGHDGIVLRKTNRLEGMPAGYAGLSIALILAPLAWMSRRHRGELVFWGIGAVVGAAYLLEIPLLSDLLQSPGLNTLKNNRLVFVTGFAILTWGVLGMDVLLRRPLRLRKWLLSLLAAPIVLGLLCVYLSGHPMVGSDQLKPAQWFRTAYLSSAMWCGVALLTLGVAILPFRNRGVVVALIGATLHRRIDRQRVERQSAIRSGSLLSSPCGDGCNRSATTGAHVWGDVFASGIESDRFADGCARI